MIRKSVGGAGTGLLTLLCLACPDKAPLQITIESDRPSHEYRPADAWGSALDGHDYSRISTEYTPVNILAMKGAHLGPVTLRLRTELAIEAWHWNPVGSWSDPAGRQGYWTSSAKLGDPITHSFGYRLPRRGRTLDDGDNDGYSRLDDGDTTTFWKSNPYLDPHFTGEREADHLQWVVVDLGRERPIDAARFQWGEPYARRFRVEFWKGNASVAIDRNPEGEWVAFEGGVIDSGAGGNVLLRLATHPVQSRFLRLTLIASSHSAPPGSRDVRDSLGFALREVGFGLLDDKGVMTDWVRHATSPSAQSEVLVSSTDPWHRAIDLDSNVVEPGMDRLFQSGLGGGRPVMIPAGILFDTPENATAELQYLRARGYPVAQVELGEEPDGQRVTPEDYGALYLQFAAVLRQVDSTITLGGPSLQTTYNDELRLWPTRTGVPGRRSWIGRFVDHLQARHRLHDFGFFSFEWYPFDDVCGVPSPHLIEAPQRLVGAMRRLRAAGLPPTLPMVMTEFGYSAYASPVESNLGGALFDADAIAAFSGEDGSAAYFFGTEPADLMRADPCGRYGNLAFFLPDSLGQVRDTMPSFWAARLLATIWADSTGGTHHQYETRVSNSGVQGTGAISSYALRRPDGKWSVLVLNRDASVPQKVQILLNGADSRGRALAGPLEVWQYDPSRFQLPDRAPSGRPARNLPPVRLGAIDPAAAIVLPPMSITVITGH